MIDLLQKENDTSGANGSSDFNFPAFHDVQARLLWNLAPNHRLRLDFSNARDSVKYRLDKWNIDVIHDPVLLGQTALGMSYHSLAAVLESDVGQEDHHQVALGQMRNHESTRVGSAGQIATSTTLNFLRQQFNTTLAQHHHFTAGVDIRSELIALDLNMKQPRCTEFDPNCDVTSTDFRKINRSNKNNLIAAYLNDRWSLTPEWNLSAGLRAFKDEATQQSGIEPRLGLEYVLTPQTTFSVAIGQHHQAPAKDQSFPEWGNPRLKAVGASHVAFGVEQKSDQDWSWRAEIYAKKFDQFVVSDPIQNYKNGGSGSAHGMEVLLKKDMGQGLTGFVSLSLSKSKRHNDSTGQNFPFEFDQPVVANAVLQYRPSETWQFGGRWSYHTGQPDTPTIGAKKDASGRMWASIPTMPSINHATVAGKCRLFLGWVWSINFKILRFPTVDSAVVLIKFN